MRTVSLLGPVGWMTALLAQGDPRTPPLDTQPAIVLLLREPIELDVATWREQWLKSEGEVDDAPHADRSWLAAEKETLVGGRDGMRFMVRAVKEPRTLTDQQVHHLFEEERAELRANQAAIEVVLVGKAPTGEPRHDAYRTLASIA